MEFLKDLELGIGRHYLWVYLGWRDIYRRYLRSFLGPFWLLINSLILVAVMGPLYSFLFKVPMVSYLVYMITGMLSWQFISQTFTEMPNVYITNAGYITDVNLPFSVYHFQMLWRNLIIYFNSLIIIIPATALFGHYEWHSILMLPIGLFLILINAFFISFLIAAFGTRFRDITPITASVLQITFFVTPIFWKKDMVSKYIDLINLNPFYHMLEVIRAPFLGYVAEPISFIFLCTTAVIGFFLNLWAYSYLKNRVAYWL